MHRIKHKNKKERGEVTMSSNLMAYEVLRVNWKNNTKSIGLSKIANPLGDKLPWFKVEKDTIEDEWTGIDEDCRDIYIKSFVISTYKKLNTEEELHLIEPDSIIIIRWKKLTRRLILKKAETPWEKEDKKVYFFLKKNTFYNKYSMVFFGNVIEYSRNNIVENGMEVINKAAIKSNYEKLYINKLTHDIRELMKWKKEREESK